MDLLESLKTKYGLKIVGSKVAGSKNDAVKVSNTLGYPVALKIDSPDILHKSDIGAVKLNVMDEDEVKKEYDNIMNAVSSKIPGAKINGVLVQEMMPEGFEIIIGYTMDEVFSPTIMLGMGGIFTDVFKDTSFRALPINKNDAGSMIDDLKFSGLLLKGFRHIDKISKRVLIDVILKVSKFAEDNFNNLDSFDINPAIFYGNDYRIVDFKTVPLKNKIDYSFEKPFTANLDIFFNASSIALVGASNNTMQIGYVIMESLLKSGYKGKVFPINPKHGKIMDVKSYPDILKINQKIDLVVIAISLKTVPGILEQCREKGIKNVIIISAGGKEIGNEKIEKEIKDLARNYNIRIIGCNCLGVFDGYSKIDTLFLPYSNMERPKSGNISLLSQSGTVGIASLELLNSYGVSKFISYGNRIDVDEGDLIQYLAKDKKSDVISIYIEGLEKGRKFYEAAKKASKKKPVIVYKASRSTESAKAAISHTGFLSGTHSMIEGVLKQAGILQVDNLKSLIASTKTLSIYKRIKGNRVLVITNGAGATIQAIDRIINKNILKLSKLSRTSIEGLKNNLPGYTIVGNPIDLTGTATDEQYDNAIETAIKDSNVDLIMVFFVFQCKPITKNITDIIKKYMVDKPIVCGTIGGAYTHDIGKHFDEEKIPMFYSIDVWVSAAEALVL